MGWELHRVGSSERGRESQYRLGGSAGVRRGSFEGGRTNAEEREIMIEYQLQPEMLTVCCVLQPSRYA